MSNIADVQRGEARGYVLGAADGERLVNAVKTSLLK